MTKKDSHNSEFLCPHCKKAIPTEEIYAYVGSIGGRAGRGESKRRTTEQARAAGLAGLKVRWGKHRKKKSEKK